MIYLSLKNNCEIKIDTDDNNILREIHEYFTFFEKDYYFTYNYQSGIWDGKISLFSGARRTIPYGLIFKLYKFLRRNGYKNEISLDKNITELFQFDTKNIEFNYDLKHYPYYYQKNIIEDAISKTKGIYVCATASGKSLIIAYIFKILYENKITKKHIIIVPNTSLIEQFYNDLIDYGLDENLLGVANKNIRQFDKTFVISTWQILQNRKNVLKDFDAVAIDECHGNKAKQISKITKACNNMTFRFGFTGTMPNTEIDKFRIMSFLGPIWKEYKPKDLIAYGYLSPCNIKHIKLKYKNAFKGTYTEIKYNVFRNEYRLNIIKSIAQNSKKTLILVEKVKDEGEFLEEYLKNNLTGKKVIFLSGKDSPKVREKWRKKMEIDDDILMIATFGIFSTGINVKSLKNVIISSSSESKIRTLQSIGRSLRKNANKEDGAYIWDLHDQVKNLKKHGNTRERFYINEEFDIQDIIMNEKIDKNMNKLFD
ncbi:MAG: DEAD/DEAH box helicase family protein [archaeon]